MAALPGAERGPPRPPSAADQLVPHAAGVGRCGHPARRRQAGPRHLLGRRLALHLYAGAPPPVGQGPRRHAACSTCRMSPTQLPLSALLPLCPPPTAVLWGAHHPSDPPVPRRNRLSQGAPTPPCACPLPLLQPARCGCHCPPPLLQLEAATPLPLPLSTLLPIPGWRRATGRRCATFVPRARRCQPPRCTRWRPTLGRRCWKALRCAAAGCLGCRRAQRNTGLPGSPIARLVG